MTADHLRLEVRLTPRASYDLIEGETRPADGRRVLSARVRAVPEKGAANEALLGLIAEICGVGRRRLSLVAGATSRLKSVRVEGDPERLAAVLELHRKNSSRNEDTG